MPHRLKLAVPRRSLPTRKSFRYASVMDPLHATIEEFAADGYTHVECYCP